jgi:hypothetical protein
MSIERGFLNLDGRRWFAVGRTPGDALVVLNGDGESHELDGDEEERAEPLPDCPQNAAGWDWQPPPKCIYDTDGDGNCHRCNHTGGCSAIGGPFKEAEPPRPKSLGEQLCNCQPPLAFPWEGISTAAKNSWERCAIEFASLCQPRLVERVRELEEAAREVARLRKSRNCLNFVLAEREKTKAALRWGNAMKAELACHIQTESVRAALALEPREPIANLRETLSGAIYTCNGSPHGCERERFNNCGYCDPRPEAEKNRLSGQQPSSPADAPPTEQAVITEAARQTSAAQAKVRRWKRPNGNTYQAQWPRNPDDEQITAPAPTDYETAAEWRNRYDATLHDLKMAEARVKELKAMIGKPTML